MARSRVAWFRLNLIGYGSASAGKRFVDPLAYETRDINVKARLPRDCRAALRLAYDYN